MNCKKKESQRLLYLLVNIFISAYQNIHLLLAKYRIPITVQNNEVNGINQQITVIQE